MISRVEKRKKKKNPAETRFGMGERKKVGGEKKLKLYKSLQPKLKEKLEKIK